MVILLETPNVNLYKVPFNILIKCLSVVFLVAGIIISDDTIKSLKLGKAVYFWHQCANKFIPFSVFKFEFNITLINDCNPTAIL